jgi:cysteine synthase
MAMGVYRALETVRNVVGVRETGGLRRLCGGEAALATAADEVDVVLGREPGLLQLIGERGVVLHARVYLPGDQHRLLAGRCQIRHANEVPLGVSPHVHQLRLWLLLKGFPDLRGGHILDHGKNSGCMRIAMTQLYHGTQWQEDMAAAIGFTPLIKLRHASEATGCTILGKAEFLNPGGSVKDRTGLYIISDAERRGALKSGGTIVEGTAGNTGIGLTLVGNARGYRCVIVMPETQSKEKIDFLRMIGADLRLVPAKPYRDPGNYVHVSRRMAEETGAVWANQFDNLANREGHRTGTGAEIWDQTGGTVDAFTCACGTGGTLAGVAMALKQRNPKVRIVLADCEGSGLYGWVKSQDLTIEGSSITEGIGNSRVTANLEGAPIDDAERIPDGEALAHIFEVLIHEGLSVGTSSGINIAAAVRVAKQLGPGHTVVTILADGGSRYQSKLFNPEFLRLKNLPAPDWLA